MTIRRNAVMHIPAAALVLVVSLLVERIPGCNSFQNFLPKFDFQASKATAKPSQQARLVEDELLVAIRDQGNRLANSDRIAKLILQLEEEFRDVCIQEPAIAPQVYGRWRLIYTTNTDTSSPIQRKAVDTDSFPIYQDILVTDNGENLLVKQIVKFSDTIELSVDALASTAAYPLEELSERKSTGKILGLNILGVSLVGKEAQEDPSRPNSRINFVFDEGNFDFGNFKLPYPVPFRFPLLRDWVKGWIDITWLSDRMRISRGNKGTTFVLVRDDDGGMARNQ